MSSQRVGSMNLSFSAIDEADRLGYNDDIGLSGTEMADMVRGALSQARGQYRNDFVTGGTNIINNGLEFSGIANKMSAAAMGNLLGTAQGAELQAQRASDQVLQQERGMYMNLLSSRDQQVNQATMTQAQIDANKKSWFDRVMQVATAVGSFV